MDNYSKLLTLLSELEEMQAHSKIGQVLRSSQIQGRLDSIFDEITEVVDELQVSHGRFRASITIDLM